MFPIREDGNAIHAGMKQTHVRREWLREIALSPVELRLLNPMEGVLLLKNRQSDEISGWLFR